jgi:predicted RNase H-like HicB family nuclease
MIKVLNFKVIVEQDEDGVFVASVPAVPGCHTQGDTYENVLTNVREAIQVCLDEANENKIYRDQITLLAWG